MNKIKGKTHVKIMFLLYLIKRIKNVSEIHENTYTLLKYFYEIE